MTTEADEAVPPEIAELIERRSTLQGWLERLEGRREDVREAVYERVRGDYRERLDEVERRLGSHRSDLERSLERRRATVAELEGEREERAARLEEAELRHEVGELDEGAFEEEASGHREALEELDAELETERAAADRLQEVLEELSGLEASDADEEPEAGTGSRWPVSDPGPADAGGDQEGGGRAGGEEEAGGGGTDSEEGAPAAERRARPTAGSAEDEEAGEATGDRPDGDELDFLESLSLDDPDALDTLSMDLDEEETDGEGDPRDGDGGG